MNCSYLRTVILRTFGIALGLYFASVGRGAVDEAANPGEQFKLLLKEFQDASSSGRVLSDSERLKFVGRVYRLRNRLAVKFIELAEKYPDDPIAVDALLQAIWQVNGTPWPVELVGTDDASSRSLALLETNYVASDKLGPACQRLSGGFNRDYETFLRTVLKKNPHHEVQGQSCLALAHFLNNRLQRLDLLRGDPVAAREFAELFGDEYLRDLQQQDRATVNREIETLFERAAREFEDVKHPYEGTVGEKAEMELFEIGHLAVGTEAPDIEGEDQDGQRFKLSDYRRKVVLLDFWSEY